MDLKSFIKKNYENLTDFEIAAKCGVSENAARHQRRNLGLRRGPSAERYLQERRLAEENKSSTIEARGAIQLLLKENEALKKERDATFKIQKPIKEFTISSHKGAGGEATIVALMSDWHIEEQVRRQDVNELNEFTLDIAKQRVKHLFSTLLRLVQIEQQNTKIKTLVVALLGDFITGNIHEELVELCVVPPLVAIAEAQGLIYSGLKYLLENSQLEIIVICHSGNHARITEDQRHATEHGNSLEWMMYRNLAMVLESEKRLKFIIPESYHSYLKVYDLTIRFHHGHNLRYGGGVGGITIPVNKAIAQWNRGLKADIDCFGHWHTFMDGNNFMANGALIGYNGYALSIKASFEEPSQTVFGIHSKLGKFVTRQVKFI